MIPLYNYDNGDSSNDQGLESKLLPDHLSKQVNTNQPILKEMTSSAVDDSETER